MKFKLNALEKKWILYDVGNSAFTLLVSTIMPIYFNALAESAGLSDGLLGICSFRFHHFGSPSRPNYRHFFRFARVEKANFLNFSAHRRHRLCSAWYSAVLVLVSSSLYPC